MNTEPESQPTVSRARGRGKSRGGLGKYLRARGRGRGVGRPAEFRERLVLEDEELIEVDPESEEYKKFQQKFSRRQLTSNADRYVEVEPELNSDGEVEEEPEVDLSNFLARQRIDVDNGESTSFGRNLPIMASAEDSDDVDHSLQTAYGKTSSQSKQPKDKFQEIEWDESLEEMRREKDVADANRELKARFRVNAEKQSARQGTKPGAAKRRTRNHDPRTEAPPLLGDAIEKPKAEKDQMEDFLDDLLG